MEPAWTAARRDEAEARAEHPCHAGGSPGNRRRRVAPKPGLRPLPETVRRSRRFGRQRKARRGHHAARLRVRRVSEGTADCPSQLSYPTPAPRSRGAAEFACSVSNLRLRRCAVDSERSPSLFRSDQTKSPMRCAAAVAASRSIPHESRCFPRRPPAAPRGRASPGIPTGLVEDRETQVSGLGQHRRGVPREWASRVSIAWTCQHLDLWTCRIFGLSTSGLPYK